VWTLLLREWKMNLLRASSVHQTAGAAAALTLLSAGQAEAHVKWFCAYDIAGRPDGLGNVLCQDFELLTGLAIAVLLAGCLFERTFAGEALTRSFDRISTIVQSNTDVLIRAGLGFFLISLWSLGGIILTPELTTSSLLIPNLQLFMAACLLWPKTMPIAAAGLVFLFGDGVIQYGLFHMMDYPIFLGIAAYLAATGLKRDIFGVSPLDVLRWSVAITLMWASIEKWAFPEWSYPLFLTHPNLSMGYEPAFFMRAAGVVEFTLSFALICTPLARRFAAVMLTATFVSAIAEFGKVDAIGHAPIIVALIAIFADKTGATAKQKAWTLAALPLQYGAALATFVALYYAGHAVAFGTPLS
jgi:hypothetical protein